MRTQEMAQIRQAGKLNGSVAEKEKAYSAADLRGLRKG